MKTGIELIIEERREQLYKHNWSFKHDQEEHSEGQLLLAAIYAITVDPLDAPIEHGYGGWEDFVDKIQDKDAIERLKIAGALIVAEIDRLQNRKK